MAGELPQPDFRSQAFRREAYARYAEMRRQNPVFRAVDIDGVPTWFILRYADARMVLQDDRRFVKDPNRIYSSERLADAPPFPDLDGFFGNHMLFKDPPDHTRLRTLVNKAFTQRMITEFEDRMRVITDELIDRVHAAGEMDLIGDFAYPAQLGNAIEEMIRYDGPVERATYRWTAEDVDFGWQTIPQGERVIVVLGAANRDPEAFPNPDVFDIRRRDNRHLGFGHGIHYCLGAWLGRMEGRIAFETLLRRLPGVKLNGSPDDLIWRRNVMLRGVEHLPIVW